MPYCGACGEKVADAGNFCGACGNDLREQRDIARGAFSTGAPGPELPDLWLEASSSSPGTAIRSEKAASYM